jgi:hypothetical protein
MSSGIFMRSSVLAGSPPSTLITVHLRLGIARCEVKRSKHMCAQRSIRVLKGDRRVENAIERLPHEKMAGRRSLFAGHCINLLHDACLISLFFGFFGG